VEIQLPDLSHLDKIDVAVNHAYNLNENPKKHDREIAIHSFLTTVTRKCRSRKFFSYCMYIIASLWAEAEIQLPNLSLLDKIDFLA
jgi:hypothetical protein